MAKRGVNVEALKDGSKQVVVKELLTRVAKYAGLPLNWGSESSTLLTGHARASEWQMLMEYLAENPYKLDEDSVLFTDVNSWSLIFRVKTQYMPICSIPFCAEFAAVSLSELNFCSDKTHYESERSISRFYLAMIYIWRKREKLERTNETFEKFKKALPMRMKIGQMELNASVKNDNGELTVITVAMKNARSFTYCKAPYCTVSVRYLKGDICAAHSKQQL